MLSNVMRIIQKIAPTTTLTLGWAHWSFGQFSKKYFIKKMHMVNIFHKPPWEAISHVWGLRYSSFREANFRRIFGEGWAETKTGFCSFSDSLVITKSVMMWISTFCTIICHFVIVIFRTVSRRQFVISL